MKVCDIVKCSLDRIVTVHEIGFPDSGWYDSDFYSTSTYFVKREPRERLLALHAIKEIGNFTIPTLQFKRVKKPGFWGWLGDHRLEEEKTGEVSGGWLRLDNGHVVYVSEPAEALKNLIEGNAKEEAK